jgi:hypothetical protein
MLPDRTEGVDRQVFLLPVLLADLKAKSLASEHGCGGGNRGIHQGLAAERGAPKLASRLLWMMADAMVGPVNEVNMVIQSH